MSNTPDKFNPIDGKTGNEKPESGFAIVARLDKAAPQNDPHHMQSVELAIGEVATFSPSGAISKFPSMKDLQDTLSSLTPGDSESLAYMTPDGLVLQIGQQPFGINQTMAEGKRHKGQLPTFSFSLPNTSITYAIILGKNQEDAQQILSTLQQSRSMNN